MRLKSITKLYTLVLLCAISFNIHALDDNPTLAGSVALFSISDSADPVETNTPFTYNIGLTNGGMTNNLTSVSFSVAKDPNLTYVSLATGPGIACTELSTEISCSSNGYLNIAPGNTLADALVITTKSTSFIGFVFADLIVSGQTIASEDTLITGVDVQITKSASIATVSPNVPFTYTLLVENITFLTNTTASSPVATNVIVTDVLPTGVTLNSVNSGLFSCTGTSTITCNLTSLPDGASETIVLSVTSNSLVTGPILNTASVTSNEADYKPNNNTSSASVVILGSSVDLSIEKSASVSSINANGAFNYVLVVSNDSNVTANNVVITDTLPAGVTLNSIVDDIFTCTGTNTITCSIASLAAGGSSLILLNVNAPSSIGDVVNTASITSDETDTNTANNSNSATVTVIQSTQVDLDLVKTSSVSEIMVNNDFQYTLSVTNNGSDAATNVVLSDALPAGVTLNSIDAGLFNCSGVTVISCQLPSLAVAEIQSIVLDVKAPSQTAVVINTANVTSSDFDTNNTNNVAKAIVNIVQTQDVSDLAVTTTGSVQVIDSGNQFSFDATVINNGSSDAQNVVVTHQIPPGFEQITVSSDNNTNCTVSALDVVCTIASFANLATSNISILGTAVLVQGVLQAQVSVTSDTFDSNTSNNTDVTNVTVSLLSMADLSLTVENTNNLNQGGSTDIQLNILNNGPDAAIQPELSFALSGLLESVSVTSSVGWNCQTANLNISCQYNNASMPSGAQSNIQLNAVTTQVVLAAENLAINASVISVTADPDMLNNTINANVEVSGTPTEDEIFTALETALNGQGNQQVMRSIRNVSSYCERSYFSGLESFCDDLYETALSGDGETINNVMEQITPNEVIGQSTSVVEMATAQFRNVGTRLAQLRSGGGNGLSLAGLNARYGSGSIPLGMLAYLNDSNNDQATDDFISPWGFFVNGTISMGDRDATGRELEFDFDTFGITAGVDYRLDSQKVIGIAVGYANFDSNVDNNTAELNSSGATLTGYGSFYVTDNLYFDTRLGLAKPDFNQSREIDFTLGGVRVQRVAKGDTSANQYSVAMSSGYHLNIDSWNITPNASFQYINTSVDKFTETGAGDFNFFYDDQEIESFTVTAGLKISKAISLSNGVITPQFDFDFIHEAKNNGTEITARFVNAPLDEIFIIETDAPDKNYGNASVGLVYVSSNGKQAYINYRRTLGLQGFSSDTFNIGARFEF